MLMLYTISDFSREYEGSVRLIAGSDGVSRAVSGVGILDYELMPGLKNKYQRVNFSSDEIILSTFLYAKDDPYLITEAVKYLVAKGTSGLIIKNVLHIPIPDQAIRYANARHYPVFLTTDDSLFFDSVIYEVKRHIEQLTSIDFAQREIDALRTDVSPESICRRIRGLNPSFLDEAVALFASFAEPLDPRTFLQIERLCAKSTLAGCHNMLAPYDGGLLFVATSDSEQTLDVERIVQALTELIEASDIDGGAEGLGISDILFGDEAVAQAISQAIYAQRLSCQRAEGPVRYTQLGILRTVMPFAETPEMRSFSEAILSPIREHDSEHGSELESTLAAFIENGRRIEQTAKQTGQHPNTIRYRLDKVAGTTPCSSLTRNKAPLRCAGISTRVTGLPLVWASCSMSVAVPHRHSSAGATKASSPLSTAASSSGATPVSSASERASAERARSALADVSASGSYSPTVMAALPLTSITSMSTPSCAV